jgi:hypothetical protein
MSRRWAHLGTKYRNCIGLAGGPSCATNLIHNLLLSRVVGMEKYRCFLGTTRENCCSLNMQNVKDKHQSGVILSLPGEGFELRLLGYLECHLTTWPHETVDLKVACEDRESTK